MKPFQKQETAPDSQHHRVFHNVPTIYFEISRKYSKIAYKNFDGGTQMAEKLKWGIISTAWINDVIIPAINKSGRSDLVGVASRDPDRARAYASKKNIPKAYGSYEDLLNDREIDVVYISVPNTLHSEWIIKALEAGKHVLCEKPIVTTMKELESVEAALKKHRVVLFEALCICITPRH